MMLAMVTMLIFVGTISKKDDGVFEKPYQLTNEEEKRFQDQYKKLLKKLAKREGEQQQVTGLYTSQPSPSYNRMMFRPIDVNKMGSNKYCCAPLVADNDGNLDVAPRSAFFSCVPCKQIRPWCPTARSKQTCDSVYCKWEDGMCKAYNRPSAIETKYCEPSNAVACYDYSSYPMVRPAVSKPAK